MTRDEFEKATQEGAIPLTNSIVDFVDILIEVALDVGLVEGVVSNEDGERRVAFHWAGETYPIIPHFFGATCCRLAVVISENTSLPFNHHEGNAVMTRHFYGVEHQLQIEFSRLQSPQFIRLTRR